MSKEVKAWPEVWVHVSWGSFTCPRAAVGLARKKSEEGQNMRSQSQRALTHSFTHSFIQQTGNECVTRYWALLEYNELFYRPYSQGKKNNRDYVLNIYYVTEIRDACYELLHLTLTQPCEIRLAIPI